MKRIPIFRLLWLVVSIQGISSTILHAMQPEEKELYQLMCARVTDQEQHKGMLTLLLETQKSYKSSARKRRDHMRGMHDYAQQQLDVLARSSTANQATAQPKNALALVSMHALSKEFLSAVIARIPQEWEAFADNIYVALNNDDVIRILDRVHCIDALMQMHKEWHMVHKNSDALQQLINTWREKLTQLKIKFSEHIAEEQKRRLAILNMLKQARITVKDPNVLTIDNEKTIAFTALLKAEADRMLATLTSAEKLIQQSSLPLSKSFALPSCL